MKKLLISLLMLCSFHAFASENLSDIQFKTLDNQSTTLAPYQGKKLYIKMWASWCPICLAGLADIDELSADPHKDFAVITVVSPQLKGEKSTADFIEWFKGLEYKNITVLLDEQGELLKRAKVRGYPSSLFIDPQLNLQKVRAGHIDSEQIRTIMAQ